MEVFPAMVAACLLAHCSADEAAGSRGLLEGSCAAAGNASAACLLLRAAARWLDSVDELTLAEGVSVVKVAGAEGGNLVDGHDEGFLGRAARFAGGRELRVRLDRVLPSAEELLGLARTDGEDPGPGTGRGKNKGGGGLAMIGAMGLMMKGVLGAIGLGGAALLAMKALMVSMMALMLSAIVGVKKLASKDDDHGTHHVQVVPVHHSGGEHGHYRRRRAGPDPYRAHRHLAG
ncbi:uncharacterized protein LOC134534576 [Bacillus rossius redtenbacheri]|uniref:uncharacterized protein LOC134534576 n=1 Tax=Bacillus rossius redtenbacheri TaxID=93214 RepID=UPI002FDE1B9B